MLPYIREHDKHCRQFEKELRLDPEKYVVAGQSIREVTTQAKLRSQLTSQLSFNRDSIPERTLSYFCKFVSFRSEKSNE